MHDYADHMWNGAQGVTRVVYEGDTIVGGYTAQKLRETSVIAPWGSTDYQSFIYPPMLTRYADGVVYAWDAWPGAYDTLMWFSAEPGQFWAAPGMDNDPYTRLMVLDTSSITIDGVPLRQLIVQRGGWDWMPPDTLRERIGFSFNYLNGWSWFVTDMPWAGLRCYRDAQIQFAAPNVTDCGFTLSADEIASSTSFVLFPNPGSDHFALSLPPGPHTITLFDPTGRVVMEERTNEQQPMIGTAHLAPGLYMVRVEDHAPLRWVKE